MAQKKIDKRYLFFKNKEDARRRFPRGELVKVFLGMEGWHWTTKTVAKTHKAVRRWHNW